MVDEHIEAGVFSLLESYSFEEILDTLRAYAETQARLAELLKQSDAGREWDMQVSALKLACDLLNEQDALVGVEVD